MLKRCVMLLFCGAFLIGAAETRPVPRLYMNRELTFSVKLADVGHVLMTETCRKYLSACVNSWKAIVRDLTPEGEWAVSPASAACERRGGRSITFYDRKHNEYAYCDFGGDFIVDAWDLKAWIDKGGPGIEKGRR